MLKKLSIKLKLNLIIIAVGILILTLPAYASAAAYFSGGYKHVSNNGAAATIEAQNPFVASGSSVSAWPMTTDVVGSYAQVGWLKFDTHTGPKHFYEYNYEPNSTWYQKILSDATVGTGYSYKVGNDSTTMYFLINGVQQGTVALSVIPFTRSEVQFFGETHNTNDQCPGSVSNPVTFSASQYKNTSNTWVSAGVTNPDSPGYGDLTTMRNNVDTGDTTWEIWDSRY